MKKKRRLNYWRLSEKDKFKRTMWSLPLMILCSGAAPLIFPEHIFGLIYPPLLMGLWFIQAVYTYKSWKKEEEEEKQWKQAENNEFDKRI